MSTVVSFRRVNCFSGFVPLASFFVVHCYRYEGHRSQQGYDIVGKKFRVLEATKKRRLRLPFEGGRQVHELRSREPILVLLLVMKNRSIPVRFNYETLWN
jgi:hypothetical protein